MKVRFPAMRGKIGNREYFATVIALSEIPRLFKFNEWEEFTPEQRAQRVLNRPRIPEMTKYILDNEDGYIFSSITASYNSKVEFYPLPDTNDVGFLEMELENAEFIINDGQHRCAAITQALKDNPDLGKEKISVLLFHFENLERLQQMFSDLNRFVHKTSKSLNILYDRRDTLSSLTMDVSEAVSVFRGMIDKEKITIPLRSPKLLTLSTLYDANKELLGKNIGKRGSKEYNAKLELATDYWNTVTEMIPDWARVKAGDMKAAELRQEKINTHAVVLRALGGLGSSLIEEHPKGWKKRLEKLKEIDWRKSVGNKVNPMWENVCITAGSVVSNRQARVATLAVLKQYVGVEFTKQEEQVWGSIATFREAATA